MVRRGVKSSSAKGSLSHRSNQGFRAAIVLGDPAFNEENRKTAGKTCRLSENNDKPDGGTNQKSANGVCKRRTELGHRRARINQNCDQHALTWHLELGTQSRGLERAEAADFCQADLTTTATQNTTKDVQGRIQGCRDANSKGEFQLELNLTQAARHSSPACQKLFDALIPHLLYCPCHLSRDIFVSSSPSGIGSTRIGSMRFQHTPLLTFMSTMSIADLVAPSDPALKYGSVACKAAQVGISAMLSISTNECLQCNSIQWDRCSGRDLGTESRRGPFTSCEQRWDRLLRTCSWLARWVHSAKAHMAQGCQSLQIPMLAPCCPSLGPDDHTWSAQIMGIQTLPNFAQTLPLPTQRQRRVVAHLPDSFGTPGKYPCILRRRCQLQCWDRSSAFCTARSNHK